MIYCIKEFLDLLDTNSEYSSFIENVVLWKKSPNSSTVTKLWGGTTNILIDTGTFVGQDRAVIENTPTVYDLALEYAEVGNKRRFNVYINGKQVGSDIEDSASISMY